MGDRPQILLVEDEPLIRTMLAHALEEGGYGLVQAQDGAEALKAIEESHGFAGVITDIRLGSTGANGWEVARQARHHLPKVAVVYMTGDSAADWTAEGVPNSVLLQKPFATAQVITAVSTLLNVVDVSPAQVSASDESA